MPISDSESRSSGVAVITGSSSGVGAACASLLLARGWTVVGLDIADAHRASDDGVHRIRCDASNAADLASAFDEIDRTFHRVDALICSAAISRLGPVVELSVDDFDAMIALNFRGIWLSVRAAVPLMKKRPNPSVPCDILFISSIAALRPKVGTGVYGASKAAINHLTQVLAGELGPSHIRVNAIAPSWMDTPMTRHLQPAEGYRRSAESPLGREATPDDVAQMVGLILSPGWTYTTGMVIPVDGGSSRVYMPSGQSSPGKREG